MRRLLPPLALLAACGDPGGPSTEEAAILAVNGAAAPLLAPAQPLAIEGRNLGIAPGIVRLPTGDGVTTLEPLAWEPTFVEVAAPGNLASGTITVITAAGDSVGSIAVHLPPPDTAPTDARPWRQGSTLPFPLDEGAAAGLTFADATGFTSVVVLTGGRRSDAVWVDSTYIGRVDAQGAITAWAHAVDTLTPPARRFNAMVGATSLTSRVNLEGLGVAWSIGGMDSTGTVLADVNGIAIGSDGSYGFWTSLAALPGNRAGAAVAAGLGALYVVGGFGRDSLARREVYVATISAGGTIIGWFRGPDLPVGVAFSGAAVIDNHLYVAGGQTGAIDPDAPADSAALSDAVYRVTLSRRTGFFVDSTWSPAPSLTAARAGHALFAAAGGLVVTGGIRADSAAAATEWAPAGADGALGPFRARTAPAIGGGAARGTAHPVIHDAAGRPVITLIGGRAADGSRITDVWWH